LNRRRILFVVNHAGFFLSHRLPIALAAQAAGYDVTIATPRSKHVPRIEAAGLRWVPISIERSGLNPFRELRTLFALRRLYRSERPDVVHHVTSKPVLYGTFVARFTRMPAVVNAISGMGHAYASGASPLLRWLVKIFYSLSLRHPRMRVIFQNDDHRNEFVGRKWVSPAEAAIIRGAGVDTNVFKPQSEPREVPVVMFASRMLLTKGVAEFIDAARMLRGRDVKAKFVLVGDADPDNPRSATEEQLRAWHDEGIVEYRGRSENMPEAFRGADIVAFPSYYAEGLPKVLIEAAACGLPIVTTDWPGCRDVVEHGVNGVLVPIREAAPLAEAIETLVRDRGLREAYGRAGREKAERLWSLDAVIDAHLAVYKELTQ
jgi:glycosyltransferase involved in cell wall biosynthesis